MARGKWKYIGAYNTIGNWRWWVVIVPVILIWLFIALPIFILDSVNVKRHWADALERFGVKLMNPLSEWTFKHRQL